MPELTDSEDVRDELSNEFEEVEYPVASPLEIAPHLTNGPQTEFNVPGGTVTALTVVTEMDEFLEFPYEDEGELVEDIMIALEENDYL